MKKLIIISVVAISLISTSCHKQNDINKSQNNLKSTFIAANAITDFYLFYDQYKVADKSYLVQSYSGIYDAPEDDQSYIMATIKGNFQPFSLNIDNQLSSFPNYDYYSDNNTSSSLIDQNMAYFFGHSYDIKSSQNSLEVFSDGSIVSPDAQLYVPKMLYQVSFENLNQSGNITAGTKIKWSADALNSNGVIIGIEYYPTTQSDSVNRIQYPDYLLRGTIAEDDGEFIFSSNDFNDFPNNAELTFYVVRGGFVNFTDVNSDNCSLGGIIGTMAGFTLAK